MLKIVTIPDPILTTSTKHVGKIDKRIGKMIREMGDTLVRQKDPQGVGLAAPQVGIGLSVFVMKSSPKGPIQVCINPKILALSGKPAKYPNRKAAVKKTAKKRRSSLEGCLSIPRIWAPLARPSKVLLEYETLEGKREKKWFTGFEAVIVQHEVDHLNGILFTHRALGAKTQIYEDRGDKLEKISLG